MTPHELLDAFETLADAPDGVKRLRELVLQLAVRGKLVPQSPDDEPAHNLLVRLARERESVLSAAGIRKTPALPSEGAVEVPFSIPAGWVWCRLSELAHPQAGFAFNAAAFNTVGHGMPLIRIRDIGQMSTEAFYSGEYREEFLVRHGDYLIGMDGNFNIRCWRGPSALLNQRVTRLLFYSAEIERKLICYSLQERINDLQGIKAYTTVQHLSGTQIAGCLVPLPPLYEQRRIVARVDELMGLLDRLEAARAVHDEVRRAARDAALAALRDAEDTEAVGLAWARISGNMDVLCSNPEDVAPLRQTILNLAVRGHLVPQDTRDEPAGLALEAARQRRSALLSDWPESLDEGRSLLRKLERATSVLHVPYKMPSGWVCTTLIDSALAVVDCHNKTAPYAMEGVPILRTTNIRDGLVVFREMRFVSELTYKAWSKRCPPRPGDVVFTREAPMGQAAIIPEGLKVCLGQRTMLIRPMDGVSSNRYILLALLEPGVRERAKHTAVGMTVQHLRVGDVESLPIMLPPLAEQHRIVAKVDTLMALCDRLEARLAAARDLQASFAAAAVHHLDV